MSLVPVRPAEPWHFTEHPVLQRAPMQPARNLPRLALIQAISKHYTHLSHADRARVLKRSATKP